jgi:hypothetical protein
MAPSMSLFSRRKNSNSEARGIERGAGAAVTPTADIFPMSPRLPPKPRSRDANPPPPSPKHLPRIRTTPVPHPEPVPRLSRSSSDVSLEQRYGSLGMPVYTAHPPPPPPGRYNNQPTPPASASSAEAARKRPFRFPVGTLPISPPLSPESPLDTGAAAGNSLVWLPPPPPRTYLQLLTGLGNVTGLSCGDPELERTRCAGA